MNQPWFSSPFAGLCIRSVGVDVWCFCFRPRQLAPRVIHPVRKGPIRADRKHPQNGRHPVSKEIGRTWMSTERADDKEYYPFWAPQKANVTFGNQALRAGAGVAYHNRAH